MKTQELKEYIGHSLHCRGSTKALFVIMGNGVHSPMSCSVRCWCHQIEETSVDFCVSRRAGVALRQNLRHGLPQLKRQQRRSMKIELSIKLILYVNKKIQKKGPKIVPLCKLVSNSNTPWLDGSLKAKSVMDVKWQSTTRSPSPMKTGIAWRTTSATLQRPPFHVSPRIMRGSTKRLTFACGVLSCSWNFEKKIFATWKMTRAKRLLAWARHSWPKPTKEAVKTLSLQR